MSGLTVVIGLQPGTLPKDFDFKVEMFLLL